MRVDFPCIILAILLVFASSCASPRRPGPRPATPPPVRITWPAQEDTTNPLVLGVTVGEKGGWSFVKTSGSDRSYVVVSGLDAAGLPHEDITIDVDPSDWESHGSYKVDLTAAAPIVQKGTCTAITLMVLCAQSEHDTCYTKDQWEKN